MVWEAIERLRFPASLPSGQREGGEKTQPFNRFQSRLGSLINVNKLFEVLTVSTENTAETPTLQDTDPKEQGREHLKGRELWQPRGLGGQHRDRGRRRRRRHQVGPRGRPPFELPARLARMHGHQ